MAIIDILITVGMVVFIATRFLGYKLPKDLTPKKKRKPSSTKTHGAQKGQVVALPSRAEKDTGKVPGLAEVKTALPDFREKEFLAGTKKAYKYYYTKRNEGDAEALEPLLVPHLLDAVITEIEEAEEQNLTFATDVKSVDTVDLLEGKMNGRTALIEVQFTATQADNMMDTKGKVKGTAKRPKATKTVWTFARPVDSEDPNWDVTSIERVN